MPDRQVVPVGKLVPPKGAAHFYHGVRLLGVALGPCHLPLAQLDEPDQDPWLLVSLELATPTIPARLAHHAGLLA